MNQPDHILWIVVDKNRRPIDLVRGVDQQGSPHSYQATRPTCRGDGKGSRLGGPSARWSDSPTSNRSEPTDRA